MFTFGRNREKENCANYISSPKNVQIVEKIIDDIHDLIENKVEADKIMSGIIDAFSIDDEGVWRQIGKWLGKLTEEYSQFETIWELLSKHDSEAVRVRITACLRKAPKEIALRIAKTSINDSSSGVRNEVAKIVLWHKDIEMLRCLEERYKIEKVEEVKDSLNKCIQLSKGKTVQQGDFELFINKNGKIESRYIG